MGVVIISSGPSAAPSPSGSGLLILFSCLISVFLWWDSLHHELFQPDSFSRFAVLHELQHGSLAFSAVLQEQTALVWVLCRVTSPAGKLLQHGLLSPWGHRSCRKLLQSGLPLRSQPSSSIYSPGSALGSEKEFLLWYLEHLLLLLHWPWCVRANIYYHSPGENTIAEQLSPYFTLLSHRPYHSCWWAWPRPAAGPLWSRPALTFLDTGEACGSFSQSHPCRPHATKTWPHKRNMYSNSCGLEKVVLKYDRDYLFYKRICIFVLSPLQTGHYLQCLFGMTPKDMQIAETFGFLKVRSNWRQLFLIQLSWAKLLALALLPHPKKADFSCLWAGG